MLRLATLSLVLAALFSGPAQAKVLDLDPKTTVVIREVIGRETVDARAKFMLIAATEPEQITIVLDSPGGSVVEGLFFIQQMKQARAAGIELRCIGTGKVISMAYYIFTECDKRYTMEDTVLMWHPIRIYFQGPLTAKGARDIASDLERLEAPLAERMRKRMNANEPYFYEHFYKETLHRGETLAQELPEFVETIEGLRGMPMVQLYAPLNAFDDQGVLRKLERRLGK